MKPLVTLILLFCLSLNGFGQQATPECLDSGFTNKAEAKNSMVNGLKEGKWVEYETYYYDTSSYITTDTSAPYYILTVYKTGKPNGIQKKFYKRGMLMSITPYVNGRKNGTEKNYNENGQLQNCLTYINNKIDEEIGYMDSGRVIYEYIKDKLGNHIERRYRNNGVLEMEAYSATNKLFRTEKWYYESGSLGRETFYVKGHEKETKSYLEDGTDVSLQPQIEKAMHYVEFDCTVDKIRALLAGKWKSTIDTNEVWEFNGANVSRYNSDYVIKTPLSYNIIDSTYCKLPYMTTYLDLKCLAIGKTESDKSYYVIAIIDKKNLVLFSLPHNSNTLLKFKRN